MSRGVHLGILLLCFVPAERVRCLWATQARGQNNNTYVGFSQPRAGFGGSYSQNQLRRASGSAGSAQSGGFNADPEGGAGSRKRFPSSRYSQTVSQTAQSGYASVGSARSRSESKPNWRTTELNQKIFQNVPKKQPFGVSASPAGGGSLGEYDQTPVGKKRTGPGRQGAAGPGLHRSSASLQSPGESFKSSSAGPAASPRIPVRTRTSASAAARRVSSRRGSAGSGPRSDPSQTRAGTPHPSKPVPAAVRDLPASGTSGTGSSGGSRTHDIPRHFGGAAIRRLREPAGQKEVGVRRQQVHVGPQGPSAHFKPRVQTVTPEPRWKRIRSRLGRQQQVQQES